MASNWENEMKAKYYGGNTRDVTSTGDVYDSKTGVYYGNTQGNVNRPRMIYENLYRGNNTPSYRGNTGGGGGGGDGGFGAFLDMLKKAYDQQNAAYDALLNQKNKEVDYQSLLGREKNNSWLKTAQLQDRSAYGDENSGLAKYSQSRKNSVWLNRMNDLEQQRLNNRQQNEIENMQNKATSSQNYANALYNYYLARMG